MEGPVNPINNDNVIPNQFDTAVPTKISTWTKIKNFLFQEITVELTPGSPVKLYLSIKR